MRRTLLAVVALLSGLLMGPTSAATPPSYTLSQAHLKVTWTGTFPAPDPTGCGGAVSFGCDTTTLYVLAAKGVWITISIDDQSAYVLVQQGGNYVANGGRNALSATASPTVTFQQVAAGRVAYSVGVSDTTGNSLGHAVAASPYTATARLAGAAFDREGLCGPTPGIEHLRDPDDGRVLPLSVRLVADPNDQTSVRTAAKGLVEIYRRVGVALRISYDFTALQIIPTDTWPFEQVQRRYGGVRPAGVDVVHVMTDNWAGGFARCIGGITLPEMSFSVGSLHHTVSGVVPVDGLPEPLLAPAALVAAHEIGHLLGAQHQQFNCVEALPAEVAQPASDGWVRPCTLMGPLAHVDSEIMSTLERSTVRSYVRRYARG